MDFDWQLVLVLVLVGGVYAGILPIRFRPWAILLLNIFALYLFQPLLPIRFSGYLLPTLTLTLTLISWRLTAAQPVQRQDQQTLFLVIGCAVAISSFRLLPSHLSPLLNRPPNLITISLIFLILFPFTLLATRRINAFFLNLWLICLLLFFITLKTEPLTVIISQLGRNLTGQDRTLAAASDLNWLGFSYITFRLIHTIRERQGGRLPHLTLLEYLNYTLFFPTLIAGPIDRAERFLTDHQKLPQLQGLDPVRFTDGLQRITIGIFKKFILADSLAQGLSLTPTLANQASSTWGLWGLLYGYAFRLYFDFSGYSDIAIGIGKLFGIQLPENFQQPYLKTNITHFWQSWHITLSQWARFYIFTPLSRWLLKRQPAPSSQLILLIAHLSTMLIIGLWHGVQGNFVIWGLWHGLALFGHKQWSDRTRRWYRQLQQKPLPKRLWGLFSWWITFHYVVLGWVWFLLPTPTLAWQTFLKLFGIF